MTLGILLVLALGCQGDTITGKDDSSPDEDRTPPTIETVPLTNPQVIGNDIVVTANITDEPPGYVISAVLYFKRETAVVWEHANMAPSKDPKSATWTGTIPGSAVNNAAGMHYYIEATDDSLNVAYKPKDGAEDPYHFTLDL